VPFFPLFVAAKQPIGSPPLVTIWLRLSSGSASLGKTKLHVHDLRRTAARNMIRAGVSEKQVMTIMGWKTHEMLDRYNIL
jgi:integrase